MTTVLGCLIQISLKTAQYLRKMLYPLSQGSITTQNRHIGGI
jgi:hypothetical protein